MTTNSRPKDAVSVSKTDSDLKLRSYRPSVPLSVYRELIKELKETQDKVVILQQENQQLREQIEEFVSIKKQIEQVVDKLDSINSNHSQTSLNRKLTLTPDKNNSSLIQSFNRTQKKSLSFFQTQHHTVNVPLKPLVSQFSGDRPLNGWILGAAIIFIVLTSCMGAFLIINFRLSYSNR